MEKVNCSDPVAKEEQLSKRNMRNRHRRSIQEKKIRKERACDDFFADKTTPEIRRAPTLTIRQKLDVVEYAENLIKDMKATPKWKRRRRLPKFH